MEKKIEGGKLEVVPTSSVNDINGRREELKRIEQQQCEMALQEIDAILTKYEVHLKASVEIPATKIEVLPNK